MNRAGTGRDSGVAERGSDAVRPPWSPVGGAAPPVVATRACFVGYWAESAATRAAGCAPISSNAISVTAPAADK